MYRTHFARDSCRKPPSATCQLTCSGGRLSHCRRSRSVIWGHVPQGRREPKGFVLIHDEDVLIRELLERWLGEAGYAVRASGDDVPCLVIVDVPHPRRAQALIQSLQAVYAAPVLVLSGRFRRGLAGSAETARRFGVKKVLPSRSPARSCWQPWPPPSRPDVRARGAAICAGARLHPARGTALPLARRSRAQPGGPVRVRRACRGLVRGRRPRTSSRAAGHVHAPSARDGELSPARRHSRSAALHHLLHRGARRGVVELSTANGRRRAARSGALRPRHERQRRRLVGLDRRRRHDLRLAPFARDLRLRAGHDLRRPRRLRRAHSVPPRGSAGGPARARRASRRQDGAPRGPEPFPHARGDALGAHRRRRRARSFRRGGSLDRPVRASRRASAPTRRCASPKNATRWPWRRPGMATSTGTC